MRMKPVRGAADAIGLRLNEARAGLARKRLQWRARPYLKDRRFSFITQNCIGARFSAWADDQFRSPTINLWFTPDGFLTLVEDLPHFLGSSLRQDHDQSAERGYPVGDLAGLSVYFMHYGSFEEAERSWRLRASRVNLDRVVVVMNDRDGFDERHLERFHALPWRRKLLLTAREFPGPDVLRLPAYAGRREVGDTYGEVDALEPVMTKRVLERLTRPL